MAPKARVLQKTDNPDLIPVLCAIYKLSDSIRQLVISTALGMEGIGKIRMAPERKKVLDLVGLCGCTRCKSSKCPCHGRRACKASCLCDPTKCENRGTLDTTDVLKHELELVEHERALCREKIEMIDCKHRDRVAEYELKLVEREKLRRQFHSEMMELKGNIRVFCRVRPVLPDAAADDVRVISYPTSTEDVGRVIDLVHSGIRQS